MRDLAMRTGTKVRLRVFSWKFRPFGAGVGTIKFWSMKAIEHQGRRVAYELEGRGSVVVLLHGFCEDHRVWEGLLPYLEGFRVLRIDLPGFGDSDPPAQPTLEALADSVRAVLQSEGIARYALVGHSMGGYVSLALAEKHPDELKGLCLFHSHPFADSEEKKAARDKGIAFVRENGVAPYVQGLIPQLFAHDREKGYPEAVNRLIQQAGAFPPEGVIAALTAMRDRPDRAPVLQGLPCPVLFIIGKEDAAVPLEQSLAMTPLPEEAEILLLEGVGHMGMFEAPEETGTALRRFLLKLDHEN